MYYFTDSWKANTDVWPIQKMFAFVCISISLIFDVLNKFFFDGLFFCRPNVFVGQVVVDQMTHTTRSVKIGFQCLLNSMLFRIYISMYVWVFITSTERKNSVWCVTKMDHFGSKLSPIIIKVDQWIVPCIVFLVVIPEWRRIRFFLYCRSYCR